MKKRLLLPKRVLILWCPATDTTSEILASVTACIPLRESLTAILYGQPYLVPIITAGGDTIETVALYPLYTA
jgi:hypothetical protein